MTKKREIRRPISINVMLMIIFLVVIQGIILFILSSEQLKNNFINEKIKDTQSSLISLQETLQFLFKRKENNQIQKTIASLGVDPDIKEGYLLDEHNYIIASTKIQSIKQSIKQYLPEKEYLSFIKHNKKSINGLKNQIWYNKERTTLYAISPLILGRISGTSFRSTRIGNLFVYYNLKGIDNKIQKSLLSNILPYFLSLLITGLGLVIYFNLTISRRIKNINNTASEFINTSYDARVIESGNDELSDLSKTFNIMAMHVQSQHNAIQESEHDLAVTLDSIGDAVIATNSNGTVTRMNPVAETLTGWTLTEAFGNPIEHIFTIIDISSRQPIENPFHSVISNGQTIYLSSQTVLISKDGTEYQIEDSAAPIRDKHNNIQGMVLVFNDVTDRKKIENALIESEQRFRQLAENIKEVFWLGSPDWKQIYYVSPAYNKNWGQDAGALYNNAMVWLESVHPDDKQQVMDDIPKSAEDISNIVDFREYRIQKPNGEILWIKARAYPIFDSQGNIFRVAGIAEDITARKNAEENLHRSQKMEALGKLTGGIAHDFNNMLGVMQGYAELLTGLLSDQPKLSSYAEEIYKAGERGAQLTKKLLSFTRKKDGNASIVNINSQILDSKNMLEKTLTVRIKLVYELTDNLWPCWIDSADFQDALLNLCINAMHSIDKKGQITIQTKNKTIDSIDAQILHIPKGDYIKLNITDTGCGMDETTKEKIFDPFFSTKGENGTGLGLSQVYGFIERSQGSIKVYSEIQHGSQFVLYFPRHQIENNITQTTQTENSLDLNGTETILVVDDEPALLSLTSQILTQYGYKTFCAENGKKALEILETEHIDLLLSDVIMPEMDGYELAAAVQERYPQIFIQLASGFSDNRHVSMVDETLHRNLLSKPYHSNTLLIRLRTLLDQQYNS